jgi:hypothetical protein
MIFEKDSEDKELTHRIIQYMAKPEVGVKLNKKGKELQETIMSKLRHRIAGNRLKLVDYFSKVEDKKTNTVTRAQWSHG